MGMTNTSKEILDRAMTIYPDFPAMNDQQRIDACREARNQLQADTDMVIGPNGDAYDPETEVVYKVEVSRPDGLVIDMFFTGYPERDIAADRESYCADRKGFTYSVSVA